MIYNMKLHEIQTFNEFKVVRVPGGWLYITKFFADTSAVFVPFNNEFEKRRWRRF
jgi:hypothetical protein